MAQAEGEVILLETMEAAAHASPKSHRLGDRPEGGASSVAKAERLLADEPNETGATRIEQLLVRGARSS